MGHFLLSAVLALLCAAPTMGVCSVPQPRLVCAEYFASKLVVEATLLKVRTIRDKDDPEGVSAFVYSMRVDRVLRGDITGIFEIYEGNDSGRATFGWKTGQKYLLFLFHSTSQKLWELDGCGNSGPLSLANGVLEQIAEIQRHNGSDGVIHGVVSQQALSSPISDVPVEARGTGRVYKATTNAKGEFEIKVRPGRYTLRGTKPGFSFGKADLSYEDPQNLRIEWGGCVQVQLVAREEM